MTPRLLSSNVSNDDPVVDHLTVSIATLSGTQLNSSNTLEMAYFVNPDIVRISPSILVRGESEFIAIRGSKLFDNGHQNCLLFSRSGDSSSEVLVYSGALTILSSTDAYCAIPSSEIEIGAYTLSFSWHPRHFMDSTFPIDILEIPTIQNILPADGSSSGGTVVEIQSSISTGKSSGVDIYCLFGSMVTIGKSLNGSGGVTCTSPEYLFGKANSATVGLRLSYSSNSNSVEDGYGATNFTYRPTPSVKTITPDKGSVLGGTTIVVEGSNFADVPTLSCTFRSTNVISLSLQSTETGRTCRVLISKCQLYEWRPL